MGDPAQPDASTVEVMRVMRRDCVRAYTEALTAYKAIEGQLGDIRDDHLSRKPLLPPQRELIATLPDSGLRHVGLPYVDSQLLPEYA